MVCYDDFAGGDPFNMRVNKKTAVLTKTEILDAAETALRKYGPDKTSVTDVAKLLGVSHGTLYRHYDSKAALKEAVTERWLDQMIIVPLTEVCEKQGHEENIPACIKAYLQKLISLKWEFSQNDGEMFEMYADVTKAAADLIAEHISTILGQLASLIRKGIEKGQIRDVQPEVLALALFDATSRFHHPAHAHEWPTFAQDEFEHVWDLLVRGFTL
jgi:AcrR family transcriptional regulator